MSINLPEDIETDDIYQWLQDGWVLYECEAWKFIGDVEHSNRQGGYVATFRRNGDLHQLPVMDVELVWPICGATNMQFEGITAAVYVERELPESRGTTLHWPTHVTGIRASAIECVRRVRFGETG